VLLLIRFLLTIFTSRFRSRIGPLEESVTTFTALPHDCDLNFHLNAGRYISFMDIARVELLGRMRLLNKLLSRGWRPVMGGCVVRFRREVKPFERFEIRSRVVGWDEKWFYLEHIVEKNGVFCAVGHMRTLVRSREGKLAPADVMKLLGDTPIEQPPLPKFVAEWSDIEDAR
jgi:acyl-CoA thioesterase FadM